jgi:hypothetical protein
MNAFLRNGLLLKALDRSLLTIQSATCNSFNLSTVPTLCFSLDSSFSSAALGHFNSRSQLVIIIILRPGLPSRNAMGTRVIARNLLTAVAPTSAAMANAGNAPRRSADPSALQLWVQRHLTLLLTLVLLSPVPVAPAMLPLFNLWGALVAAPMISAAPKEAWACARSVSDRERCARQVNAALARA